MADTRLTQILRQAARSIRDAILKAVARFRISGDPGCPAAARPKDRLCAGAGDHGSGLSRRDHFVPSGRPHIRYRRTGRGSDMRGTAGAGGGVLRRGLGDSVLHASRLTLLGLGVEPQASGGGSVPVVVDPRLVLLPLRFLRRGGGCTSSTPLMHAPPPSRLRHGRLGATVALALDPLPRHSTRCMSSRQSKSSPNSTNASGTSDASHITLRLRA